MDYRTELEKLQNLYLHTERQFLEISRIIPLDNSSKTYSPDLYAILLTTCGQIESIMRILRKKLGLGGSQRDDFPTHFRSLNQNSLLKSQIVYFIPKSKKFKNHIKPFVLTPGKTTPSWWNKYNKSKHDLPQGLLEGNIENTVKSLAGLYSLHYIAYLAITEQSSDIFNPSNWIISFLADARDSVTRKALRTEQYLSGYSDFFSMRQRYAGRGAPI